MGIVIMRSGDFQALMDRIEAIEKYINKTEPKTPPLQEIWLDNEVVCSYLKISKRTLQRYRSNGVITYSLIGKKTYYTISEIKWKIQRNCPPVSNVNCPPVSFFSN